MTPGDIVKVDPHGGQMILGYKLIAEGELECLRNRVKAKRLEIWRDGLKVAELQVDKKFIVTMCAMYALTLSIAELERDPMAKDGAR